MGCRAVGRDGRPWQHWHGRRRSVRSRPREFSEAWILVQTGTLMALFFGFSAIYQVAVIGEPWPSEENDQLRH